MANWIMYDSAKEFVGDGTIDFDGQTFKCSLHSSTYNPNIATQSVYADLTGEVANGNGYTTGGLTLSGVTWGQAGGTATFDSNDMSWTATGGNIGPLLYAVVRSTSGSEPLICYTAVSSSNVTITTGSTAIIQISSSGILTLSGATS